MLTKFDVPVIRTVLVYGVVVKTIGRSEVKHTATILLNDNNILRAEDSVEVEMKLAARAQFDLAKLGLGDIPRPEEINYNRVAGRDSYYIGRHRERLEVAVHVAIKPVLEYNGTVFSLASSSYDYTERDLAY